MEMAIDWPIDITYLAELTPHQFLWKERDIKIWSKGDGYRRFHFKCFIKNWCGVKFADAGDKLTQQLRFTLLRSVNRLLI